MRRLAALAATAVLLASCAGQTPPPLLPIEAQYTGGYAEIDDDWHSLPVRFVLAEGVSTSVRDAPAYRLGGDVTRADAERLARAAGVSGPVARDEYSWTAGVFDGTGPGFAIGYDRLFSMRSDYFPPTACHDTSPGASSICAAPTTTTIVAPKPRPSVARAEHLARRAMATWRIDGSDSRSVSTIHDSKVRVRLIREVDGLRAKGFEFVVEVDGDGVASAYGFLATAIRVGDYDLTSVEHALTRLNAPGAAYSEAERVTIMLRSVQVGLMISYAGDHDVWLTPAYIFATDDGRTVAAPAAMDEDFAKPGN